MNRNNHEDNTNKARHNIYEYAQKNSEKYIKKIDEMRSSKDRMTFKNSGKYLWSLIVLGINWMVYCIINSNNISWSTSMVTTNRSYTLFTYSCIFRNAW